MSRLVFCSMLSIVSIGCQTLRPGTVPVTNPIHVQSGSYDLVWEKTVDVLHQYQFAILRENRLSGEIETDYKTGASLLEPWHRDATNLRERTEGTLQSIRRKVLVHITQVENGYLVSVEAFKELEDLAGLAANSPGDATFPQSEPLERELNQVVGQTTPSGWISKGRDLALEQSVLASLNGHFQGR
ncbi:MAG TPA: hypothetical protein VLA12_16115 [Planctomycetaceae bacterium]|nr:hypothetical protein [Planctomycetaceae bacterium]